MSNDKLKKFYENVEATSAAADALDIAKKFVKGNDRSRQVKRALNLVTSKKGKTLAKKIIEKKNNR